VNDHKAGLRNAGRREAVSKGVVAMTSIRDAVLTDADLGADTALGITPVGLAVVASAHQRPASISPQTPAARRSWREALS